MPQLTEPAGQGSARPDLVGRVRDPWFSRPDNVARRQNTDPALSVSVCLSEALSSGPVTVCPSLQDRRNHAELGRRACWQRAHQISGFEFAGTPDLPSDRAIPPQSRSAYLPLRRGRSHFSPTSCDGEKTNASAGGTPLGSAFSLHLRSASFHFKRSPHCCEVLKCV